MKIYLSEFFVWDGGLCARGSDDQIYEYVSHLNQWRKLDIPTTFYLDV